MPGKRVFVIWTHPLFHDSVRLLLSKSEVEIVGATSDHAAAQNQIAALAPDVVIVEQTDGEEQSSVETISILRAGPQVIRLGLADNEISLYQRERRTAAKADDLVSLITGQRQQDAEAPDK
jgi:DNA-binding NarL/FixJ family response regulator